MRANFAALFDLDGTLVDAFADIAAAVNAALRARGREELSLETVKSYVGSGIRELCQRAAPGLEGEALREFVEHVRCEYEAHPSERSTVYPGIADALFTLGARGVPCAVISNKPHRLCGLVCDRLGLTELLDAIQGEDPPRVPRKPNPTGARMLMDRLNVDKAVVIGDMEQDAELAQALGAPFIAVAWGGGAEDALARRHPVALCRTAEEMLRAIDAMRVRFAES